MAKQIPPLALVSVLALHPLEPLAQDAFPPPLLPPIKITSQPSGQKAPSNVSNSSRSGLRGNAFPQQGNIVPPREDIYIQTAEIESKCLYSWDDSHQLHSEEIIIEWNYQAVKTTMKRLHHCIRLKVTGPIDVEGIATSYVDRCVDYGLKKNSTRHALEAIIALGVDILSLGDNGVRSLLRSARRRVRYCTPLI